MSSLRFSHCLMLRMSPMRRERSANSFRTREGSIPDSCHHSCGTDPTAPSSSVAAFWTFSTARKMADEPPEPKTACWQNGSVAAEREFAMTAIHEPSANRPDPPRQSDWSAATRWNRPPGESASRMLPSSCLSMLHSHESNAQRSTSSWGSSRSSIRSGGPFSTSVRRTVPK